MWNPSLSLIALPMPNLVYRTADGPDESVLYVHPTIWTPRVKLLLYNPLFRV